MRLSKALTTKKNVGQLLVEAGLINEEQLKNARELAAKEDVRLEQILVRQRLASPQQIAFLISLELGVSFVNLKRQGVEAHAVALIPETVARKYNVIAIDTVNDAVVIAMEDPTDIHEIEELTTLLRRQVEPVLATSQDIQEMIDLNYRAGSEIEEQLSQIPGRYKRISAAYGEDTARVSAEAIAQAPVVRAIDLLIKQAARDRASDVHIEPQSDKLRIRYRIDGILHEVMSLPLSVHPPLLSRIKIMSGLNIAERRRPQDGQITFNMNDREIDIRVATSATVYGEMAVLRILDKTFAFLPLSEIGFLPNILERYLQIIRTPFGMILISGPTGSGKTTTLYATVNQMDATRRNILTIEDPVEYRFANINQMQVNPSADVTFATGLRAALRLDPNVILVGEASRMEVRISRRVSVTLEDMAPRIRR